MRPDARSGVADAWRQSQMRRIQTYGLGDVEKFARLVGKGGAFRHVAAFFEATSTSPSVGNASPGTAGGVRLSTSPFVSTISPIVAVQDTGGRRWAYLGCRDASGGGNRYQPIAQTGMVAVVDETGSGTGGTTTDLTYSYEQTGAVAGSAGIAISSDAATGSFVRLDRNPFMTAHALPNVNVSQRQWMCAISDTVLATWAASEDFDGNYLGFRTSTLDSETNWYFIVRKTGGTQVKVDTGLAATNTWTKATWQTDGTTLRWQIATYAAYNGALNGSASGSITHTANFPAGTVQMSRWYINGLYDGAGANRWNQWVSGRIELD